MRGVDTYLALKPQVDLKTPREIADLAAGDYLSYNSESLGGSQQIISNPSIRREAMRGRAFSALGTMDASGSIEFTASNFVLNTLLPLIFHAKTGTAEAADGSGATYSLTEGGVLTPFSAFVGFDGPEGAYTRRFTGAKINTAAFSARVDDMLRVNVSVAAINKEILDQVGTPTYPGGDVEFSLVFSDAVVKLKSGDMVDLVSLPVENFDLNINHNLNTGAYRLGSVYRRSLQEGVTDVDGTFTVDAATAGVNGEALNADGSATHDPAFFERAARNAKFAALEFTVVDPTRLVADAATSASGEDEYARLTIEIPYARLEEPQFNVSDAGLISGSARFVAYDELTATHVAPLS